MRLFAKGTLPVIETAARSVQFLLAIGIAYLIALWFALVAWTFRDIESRSRSVFTQVFSTLLVVLFFVPGLLLYLILRPKESLDQAFQRALEEEYLLQDLDELPLCPGCQRTVDPEFVLCPHCQTQLRSGCSSCGRLVDLRWTVCPYCAVPVDTASVELPRIGTESVPSLESARAERRKRAMTVAAERVGIPPEELDAFTDALSASEGPAAVGAGSQSARDTAVNDGLARLTGMRARLGQFAANPFERPEPEENGRPPSTAPGGSDTASSRFWSEPLPGANRGTGTPSDSSDGRD